MHSNTRSALIGIGSNSTRLLVVSGSEPVERAEVVTRLASYEIETGGGGKLLAEGSMRATVAAAAEFARRAQALGAPLVAVIATEAVRVASNRQELITRLEQELGTGITIISGEEEALLGWQAVASAYRSAGRVLGVLDIGGASTDISLGSSEQPEPQVVTSTRLGSRTVMQRFRLDRSIGPQQLQAVTSELRLELANDLNSGVTPGLAVVIGGTADVLAEISSYASGELYSTQDALIDRAWLQEWLENISAMDLAERTAEGVPEDRADVIVAGAAILLSLIDLWGLGEFYTSRRNILDGYARRAVPYL